MVLKASTVLIAGSGHRRRSSAWQLLLLSISADCESNHHSHDRSEPWPGGESGVEVSSVSQWLCFLSTQHIIRLYILVIKERNPFVLPRAERKSFSDELAGRGEHTWNTNRDYRKGLEHSHWPTLTGLEIYHNISFSLCFICQIYI